jgi:hypothetical protein
MITLGHLSMDLQRYLARWKDEPIQLTVTEFLILRALARHPGHVKSRQQLMEEGYPHDTFVSDRTIDSHIKRLRKKFNAIDPDFDGVETVYGLGLPLPRELMRWPFRISIRLLAFNLLLVFLPAGGLLLLDTYEQHLLEAQERTMAQEGPPPGRRPGSPRPPGGR